MIAGISIYEMLGFVMTKCRETAADSASCDTIYKGAVFDLAFVTYPAGISMSYCPNLFGILFFGCLLLLGIDSAFAMIISFVTVIEDAWFARRWELKKSVLTGIVCLVGFLLGFIYLFDTGFWLMDIADHYLNDWCLMLIGFVQAVAVGW